MANEYAPGAGADHWLRQSEMWLAELPDKGVPDAAVTDLRENAVAACEAEYLRARNELSDRLARAEALLREWRQAGYLETKNADAHDHHVCGELADAYRATDAYFADIEERDP